MKWIIYLLLLANLGFGLWHYRSQALNQPQTQNKSDNDNLRLVLLREYLAQQNKAPTVVADADAQSLTDQSCYTLGPFKAVKDANSVRAVLKKASIEAKRRVRKDKTRKGFWVLLPPAVNHAKARESVEELKAKGVTDYFLVANGDQTNAISLGVFAKSETAQSRYQEIKGMGFTPRIQGVDLPMREYWLDWPVSQVLSTKLLEKLRKQYSGIGQAERSCTTNG